MESSPPDPSLKTDDPFPEPDLDVSRKVALLLLSGIGCVLVGGILFDVYQDWIPEGKPLWSTLVENALPLLFALAVPYATWLLSASERGAQYVSETTKWAVLGAGATLLVASVGVGLQIVQGELKPLVIVTQMTAAGTVAGLLIGYSVAEIRQAHALLAERENQLLHVAENVSDGIFRYAEPDEASADRQSRTDDGEVVYANAAFAEMLGYDSVQEVLEATMYDLFVRPALRSLRSTKLDDQGLDEAADGLEVEIHRDEGRFYTGLLRCTRTVDEQDGSVYYDGVITDISEQKDRQRELREEQEQYRTLVKQFPDGAVFLFDQLLTHTLVGGGGLSEMGMTADHVEGRTPEDVFPASVADELTVRYKQSLAGAAERFELVYDDRTYLVRTLPVGRGDGGVRRGMAVMVDITEQKRQEERVERLNDSLEDEVEKRTRQVQELSSALTEAEEKERERLSRLLHDDLQQTLYGAEMLMEKIRTLRAQGDANETGDEPELHAEVKAMLDQAIETTRSLSADLRPPVLEDESLAQALEWLAGRMKADYDLSVDVQAEGPIPIPDHSLRVLLFRFTRELLFNVVKHAEVDEAQVQARREEPEVWITVSDDGTGFDLDDQDLSSGDGLGLTSVYKRLEGMGGHLDVDTEPGGGTDITIRVPVEPGAMIWPTPALPAMENG